MLKPELFHKTVSILINAYLNDTLEHTICGCAVHNIVTHIARQNNPLDTPRALWSIVFVTTAMGGREFNIDNYKGDVAKQIDSTGYTPYELSDIEYAFESGDKNRNNNFNGLMSVLDALMQIHEANQTEINEAKMLFVK